MSGAGAFKSLWLDGDLTFFLLYIYKMMNEELHPCFYLIYEGDVNGIIIYSIIIIQ